MNEIQQRIDTLCKLKKISKYRLAKNAGIPYTTLSNAYRNDTMPTIPTLMSICKGLGITMAQFFMDDEDKQIDVTERQAEYIKLFNQLSQEDQDKAIAYVEGLSDKE